MNSFFNTQICQKHCQPKQEICGRQTCLNLYCFQCFTEHRTKYSLTKQDHNISVTFSHQSKDFFIKWNQYLIPKLEDMINVLKFKGTYKNIFYIFTKSNDQQTNQIKEIFDSNILKQISTSQVTKACIDVMSSHLNLIIENIKYLSKVTNLNELNHRQFLRDLFFLFVQDAEKNLKMIPRLIEDKLIQRFGVIEIYRTLGIRFENAQVQQMQKYRKQILKNYEQKGNQIGVMNNHVKINTMMKSSHGQFLKSEGGLNRSLNIDNKELNKTFMQTKRSSITPMNISHNNNYLHQRNRSTFPNITNFTETNQIYSLNQQYKIKPINLNEYDKFFYSSRDQISNSKNDTTSSSLMQSKLQQMLKFTAKIIKTQSSNQNDQLEDQQKKSYKSIQEDNLTISDRLNDKEKNSILYSASTNKQNSEDKQKLLLKIKQNEEEISKFQSLLKEQREKHQKFKKNHDILRNQSNKMRQTIKQKDDTINFLRKEKQICLKQIKALKDQIEAMRCTTQNHKQGQSQQYSGDSNKFVYKNVRGNTPNTQKMTLTNNINQDMISFGSNNRVRILSPRIRQITSQKYFSGTDPIKDQQILTLKSEIDSLKSNNQKLNQNKLKLEQQIEKLNQKLRIKQNQVQEYASKCQEKHLEQIDNLNTKHQNALNQQLQQIQQIKMRYEKYIQSQSQNLHQLKTSYQIEQINHLKAYNDMKETYEQKIESHEFKIYNLQKQLQFLKQKEQFIKQNEQTTLQKYLQNVKQLDNLSYKLKTKQQDYLRLQQINEILRNDLINKNQQYQNIKQINNKSDASNSRQKMNQLIDQQKKIIQDMQFRISEEGININSRQQLESQFSQEEGETRIKQSVTLAQQQAEAFLEQAKKINMQLAVQNSILKKQNQDLQKNSLKLQNQLKCCRQQKGQNKHFNINQQLLGDIIELQSQVVAQKNNSQKLMQFLMNYADQNGIKRSQILEKLNSFNKKNKIGNIKNFIII